jgi:hypothetical protein
MDASNPWDPFTVGKNADGSFDVIIRARVSVEDLQGAQAAILGFPGVGESGEYPMVAQPEQMVSLIVGGQLVGQPMPKATARFEEVHVSAVPGATTSATRPGVG